MSDAADSASDGGDRRAFDPEYSPSDPYHVTPEGMLPEMFDGEGFLWVDDDVEGKVPKQVGDPSENAKSNDPATWEPFDEAVTVAADHDERGVGFSLTQDTPLFAVDIDIPDGGAWVPDLGLLGGATAEYSPSGNLRVYLRDVEIPEWWTNLRDDEDRDDDEDRPECKLFDGAGYVTVTGDLLPGFDAEVTATSQPVFEKWLKDAWRAFPDSRRGDDETPPWDAHAPAQATLGDAVTATAEYESGGAQEEWLTGDDIRDALGYIDPNTTYDRWRNVGFALTSFFGDDATALDVFCAWSRGEYRADDETGPTGWDSGAGQLAEHIVRYADPDADRGVTTGTIVKFARDGGWTLPDRPAGHATGGGGGVDAAAADAVVDESAAWDDRYRAFLAAVDDDESPMTATADQKRATLTDFLLDDYTFMSRAGTGNGSGQSAPDLWMYDPETGIYDPDAEATIRKALGDRGVQLDLGSTDRAKVVNNLIDRSSVDPDTFDAGGFDADLVALDNAVLNVDTQQVVDDLSPAYRFRSKLAVAHDPDADCPRIDAFLTDVTDGDDRKKETLYQWIGFCLTRGYDPEKFLLLYGGGGNGKGVFFDVVRAFFDGGRVGRYSTRTLGRSVAGVGLDNMTEDDGPKLAQLDGAFVNIDGDVNARRLSRSELGTMKKLTGNDPVTVSRKYKPEYQLRNTAKLTFAANSPPLFGKLDEATARRLLAIEFPRDFAESEWTKTGLVDHLTTDAELSGLLNRALDALATLRRDGQFAIERGASNMERAREYEQAVDPIAYTAANCFERREGAILPKALVEAVYQQVADEMGEETMDSGRFWTAFYNKFGAKPEDAQRRVGDDRPRVFLGLWPTADAADYMDVTEAERVVETAESQCTHLRGHAAGIRAQVRGRAHDAAPGDDREGGRDGDRESAVAPDAEGSTANRRRLLELLREMEADRDADADPGVHIDDVYARAHDDLGFVADVAEDYMVDFCHRGKVYSPATKRWRST